MLRRYPKNAVVPVVAAVAPSDIGEVLDELNALDPLNLVEAELDLVAQPQRCPVAVVEWQVVHAIGQHRQVVAPLPDWVSVVVDAAVRAVAA